MIYLLLVTNLFSGHCNALTNLKRKAIPWLQKAVPREGQTPQTVRLGGERRSHRGGVSARVQVQNCHLQV